VTSGPTKEKDTEFSLSWCQSRFLPPMLAVACGKEHATKIYRMDETTRKWQQSHVLSGHRETIHDVAWAPSLGRYVRPR
jgi:nucleoporin SEH1